MSICRFLVCPVAKTVSPWFIYSCWCKPSMHGALFPTKGIGIMMFDPMRLPLPTLPVLSLFCVELDDKHWTGISTTMSMKCRFLRGQRHTWALTLVVGSIDRLASYHLALQGFDNDCSLPVATCEYRSEAQALASWCSVHLHNSWRPWSTNAFENTECCPVDSRNQGIDGKEPNWSMQHS